MTLQLPDSLGQAQLRELSQIDWSEIFRWQAILPDLLRVGTVLLLAFAGYRVVKLLSARLEREIKEQNPLVKRMREQRAQTLASLLNNVGLVVIVAIAGLTILNTFIPIAPLLATAGIAGLAISFGAQSLVKDVITGAFILIEGQFAIGDVVRVGETAGLVERITLRTTILRDLNGVVHILPNGEITRLSNLTKGWSRALLEIRVAYKEDVDRITEVLREIGRDLHADPEWAALLLEEPEVPGIERFDDSGVVFRMLARTLPLKQWDVARELRRRIKRRFDAEGIEMPFPHQTFYWGEDQMPPAFAAPLDPADGPLAAGRPRAGERED